MKNSLLSLSMNGVWFVVETTGDYTGGIGNYSFAAGVSGYARRNRKQLNYIDLIAPLSSSPEQIAVWYLYEPVAEQLLKLKKPAPKDANPNELWKMVWQNMFQLKTLNLEGIKII